MIQPTSLEAYHVLKPKLGSMQNLVYNFLQLHPNSSNHDISHALMKPINSITPRVKELRDKGLVIMNGYKIDEITNKRVIRWTTIPC